MRISFFAATVLLAVSAFVQVREYSVGQLYIEHPWALAPPPASSNGATYLMVQNHGKENDTLLGADTPCAASAEVREHMHKNGMTSMQKVGSVDVTPGKDLCFTLDGYHLMLIGPKQSLVAGECFPLTLHFRGADDVPVEIVAEPKAPAEQDGHGQHDH